MDTLKEAVEEFLKAKKYIYGFNKDTVERLMRGNSKLRRTFASALGV